MSTLYSIFDPRLIFTGLENMRKMASTLDIWQFIQISSYLSPGILSLFTFL